MSFTDDKIHKEKNQDLAGRKFNKWMAISYNGRAGTTKIQRWMCQCDCGTIRDVSRKALISNRSKSCGCEKKPHSTARFTKKNGYLKPSAEYYTWFGMKNRCLNSNTKSYKNYGARGIKICARWIDSFDNFLTDMGKKPSPKHSLERIDNNGNYEPSNCRWATIEDQNNNKANTKFITHNGITLSIGEWSKITGIKYMTLYMRIFRENWSVERALTNKVK